MSISRRYIARIKPEIERVMAQLRERYAGDHAAIDRAAESYVRDLCGCIQDKHLRAAVFGIAWAARTDDKVREALAAQLQIIEVGRRDGR